MGEVIDFKSKAELDKEKLTRLVREKLVDVLETVADKTGIENPYIERQGELAGEAGARMASGPRFSASIELTEEAVNMAIGEAMNLCLQHSLKEFVKVAPKLCMPAAFNGESSS